MGGDPCLGQCAPRIFSSRNSRACGANTPSRWLDWICSDAGARTLAGQRAKERDAFDGAANAEAACLPQDAAEEDGLSDSSGALAISGGPSSAILAGALLRFQCVHREKETREA